MQILIVSATSFEVKNLINELHFTQIDENFYNKDIENNSVDILITGVGIAFTSYNLTKALSRKKYDFVINAGIAGSLSEELNIGDVVQVKTEEFADLGIRSKDSFSTLFDMGFIKADKFPFTDGKLNGIDNKTTLLNGLKKLRGITVNTVNGNKEEIKKLKQKFNADIESMEGAAVFYICLMEKVPFAEIRSISNYVEERNKGDWDIPLAIKNLNDYCKDILDKI
ncbi:MAG: futalosine hydrolase [Bacteroidetes bacterium]|nr:MAG: futalosine hydrolase [Bacteroidota bacterium]